ncbi:MAG: hypothetical protein BJ554DRAFT_3570 [Olpidium bornovanus]|uniref:Uncharacterized protein n=1 Tax=Olpidium bornovanus TaxID=278681 RepID=A0A8H8DFV2_9FUNG|nr:MAG: hypothetical protein BJ554DRAFT_3570 [Olpidium bornovanus]
MQYRSPLDPSEKGECLRESDSGSLVYKISTGYVRPGIVKIGQPACHRDARRSPGEHGKVIRGG